MKLSQFRAQYIGPELLFKKLETIEGLATNQDATVDKLFFHMASLDSFSPGRGILGHDSSERAF